ncbi:hypothetical protein KOR34_37750 [Posidoniimonas corsicana]|uniref:Peptidase M10 metallopeptidase domain-containing protein n=1 Tax=Posidoniimonas corsicana TaxID=1938618 RepID=A0A5C5V7V1_9BACT|nr:hypothetical protein [Posidoniimonas corsicana]TWT33939.1 hypothetical protein KOR34_37750 [Posidoniimonas corsicana]
MAKSIRGCPSNAARLTRRALLVCWACCAAAPHPASGITITLDFTLDAVNDNWFDPATPAGLARRASVESAAGFLTGVIQNSDWEPLGSLNESLTFTDIAAPTIKNLNGETLIGDPESDGVGYSYTTSANDVDTTNRASVAANEYVVYVGAFAFDSGTTSNAKASWDSADRRNDAGRAGAEFNTWGGKVYFNTAKDWYTGQNPGVDPTDDYGVQDPDKSPAFDSSSDNWDWSTSSDSWKGFDLRSVDPTATGMTDLYATALHELMHALGATSSTIEDYVGVDGSGDFTGPNLLSVYGGPVPGDGGHFAQNTQSAVWGSDGIISETVLDPNSLAGVRKYFTDLDAALLRDLGYDVLDVFPPSLIAGDYTQDGLVDAADYSVWRDNLGTGFAAADGDNSGTVDEGDYLVWRNNFSAGVSAMTDAPEPCAAWLAAGAALAARAGRRR